LIFLPVYINPIFFPYILIVVEGLYLGFSKNYGRKTIPAFALSHLVLFFFFFHS
jgi:hypothetical protein